MNYRPVRDPAPYRHRSRSTCSGSARSRWARARPRLHRRHRRVRRPGRRPLGSVVHGLPVVGPTARRHDALVVGVGAAPPAWPATSRSPSGGAPPSCCRRAWPHSAISAYRLSRTLHLEGLTAGADLVKAYIHSRFNSVIPYTAVLGEGTTFGYGGIGVVVHTQAVVGTNCKIGQNVTIGARGSVLPVIGDHVFLGAGAVCVGGRIGSRVVVGSNAVVTKEVPDDSVVAGSPARVIGSSTTGYDAYLYGRAD